MMYDRLYGFFKYTILLADEFEFRKNKSTCMAIIFLIEKVNFDYDDFFQETFS